MSGFMRRIRKIIYGVPSDSAKRAQIIRDEIVDNVEEESWHWDIVRDNTQISYNQLKSGKLPEEGDEIQTMISQVCQRYHSRGYTIEDLKKGVDGAQARASAKAHSDSDAL